MTRQAIQLDDHALASLTLAHLESVVRVDSASDERSDTIPSTRGQARLGEQLKRFFIELGATVEIDRCANVIATLPGRGALIDATPLALMVHLDTARGTRAVESLSIARAWDGHPIRFSANERLVVGVETYPDLQRFVGHDVIFGPGDAAVGFDDKLGLAQMMTLALALTDDPTISHRPLVLIARPDEEIGRHAALDGIAEVLVRRGVTVGYTLDGIDPYEINVDNFYASHASITFAARRLEDVGDVVRVALGGVNAHGATARAEGHRAATRFAAELTTFLEAHPDTCVTPIGFASDAARDCDAALWLSIEAPGGRSAIETGLERVVSPHVIRGASWSVEDDPDPPAPDAATGDMLAFVGAFLASSPGFVLLAEESDGRLGYSHPYRALPTDAGLVLDIRIRDFDPGLLEEREAHVTRLAADRPCEMQRQYVNMGPALAGRDELVDWPLAAGAAVGVASEVRPIRGGTGVDPLLEAGVYVANLGTGYFAPESEKELTTLQLMAGHVRWLGALVQSGD